MLGYTINKINLDLAINNSKRIIKNIDSELILYDHHLARDKKFKERTKEVWDLSNKNKKVMTAAEYLGKEPKALKS
mgnify:CR=1 FL=1